MTKGVGISLVLGFSLLVLMARFFQRMRNDAVLFICYDEGYYKLCQPGGSVCPR
jgi:hypothetical protein